MAIRDDDQQIICNGRLCFLTLHILKHGSTVCTTVVTCLWRYEKMTDDSYVISWSELISYHFLFGYFFREPICAIVVNNCSNCVDLGNTYYTVAIIVDV